jgi:hypothetical protein
MSGTGRPLAEQEGNAEAAAPLKKPSTIAALSARFQHAVEDAFERVGTLCAARPRVVFALCIALCFVCALGTKHARMDGDPYSMFTVYRGQWELGNAYTLAHQGGEPGIQPTFEYLMLDPIRNGGDARPPCEWKAKMAAASAPSRRRCLLGRGRGDGGGGDAAARGNAAVVAPNADLAGAPGAPGA